MPIVHMLDNELTEFPEGAYCSLYWSRHSGEPVLTDAKRAERCPHCDCGLIKGDEGCYPAARCIVCQGSGGTGRIFDVQYWSGVVVLHETHHGLCIREREYNGRDDSDFFMLVWEPVTKRAYEIEFATTRGWSYPCYDSRPDATPDVMAEYEAWQQRQKRKARALSLLKQRRADMLAACSAGLRNRHDVRRLRSACGEATTAVLKLLATKRFRSEFRQSLATQVRTWLADPAPKHESPLSPRQIGYLFL